MGRAWWTFSKESRFKPVKLFGIQLDIPLSRTEVRLGMSPTKNRGKG